MSPDYGSNSAIIRFFHKTKKVKISTPKETEKQLLNAIVVDDIVNTETGEVIVPHGTPVTKEQVESILSGSIKDVEVVEGVDDPLILNSLREDDTDSHESALLRIYSRLRPGNPPNLDKAKDLFHERFFDATRYRLGRVGRFRINRKYGQDVPDSEMTLNKADILNSIRYIMELRASRGEVDDIDHLGNRRVRSIGELAGDELRKGFLKLRRTAQERMNLESIETATPRSLINSKTISSNG